MNPPFSKAWSPRSWRSRPLAQGINYPDSQKLFEVESRIMNYPALVFEQEVRQLKKHLASVAKGEAFLLQGGDCAESFEGFRTDKIRDDFRVLLQMSLALTLGARKSVVKVGRVAGQFAKPRSGVTETQNSMTLPSYRGDLINGHAFDSEHRKPDPERMERAYFQSAATLNLLRAYAKGGFADLRKINSWNLQFAKKAKAKRDYEKTVQQLHEILDFMQASGLQRNSSAAVESIEFFTSHEALLLNYEEALLRLAEFDGKYYAGSAHMIWIGERTRDLDGAHVEFARGVENPIGLKCGPRMSADELLPLIDRLNPQNEGGRLVLIPRMGVHRIAESLPGLLRAVRREGRSVVWACDPMHGNTYTTVNGFKTRSFQNILQETQDFFALHEAEGTIGGGLHLEFTGRDVIECTGGDQNILDLELAQESYETLCDPRLNASQSLELVFQLVETLKNHTTLRGTHETICL